MTALRARSRPGEEAGKSLLVRTFQWGDVSSVADLMGELGYPVSVDVMSRRMQMIESNPLFCTFVAEHNGKVVGVLGASQQILYEADEIMAQINVLVAKSDYRGMGVGKALLQEAESWAREHHATGVYLTSGKRPERNGAHEFYRRRGYDITGYRFVKTL